MNRPLTKRPPSRHDQTEAGSLRIGALRVVRGHRFRDHLDGQVRAVALAQPAEDAVLLLDDGVIAEHQRVLGADLDTDVAALAEDRVPADVRVVDPANAVLVIVGDPGSEADGGSGRLVRRHGPTMIDPRCAREHPRATRTRSRAPYLDTTFERGKQSG